MQCPGFVIAVQWSYGRLVALLVMFMYALSALNVRPGTLKSFIIVIIVCLLLHSSAKTPRLTQYWVKRQCAAVSLHTCTQCHTSAVISATPAAALQLWGQELVLSGRLLQLKVFLTRNSEHTKHSAEVFWLETIMLMTVASENGAGCIKFLLRTWLQFFHLSPPGLLNAGFSG